MNSRFHVGVNSGIVVGENSNVVVGNLTVVVGANLGFNAGNSRIFIVKSMIVVCTHSTLGDIIFFEPGE